MTEKQVKFKNKGKNIFGVLHLPKTNGKFPCVVLCHGFTGHKAEAHFLFTKISRNLMKKGFASLRFDFRGSGDSEGEFKDMSIEEEISDAECAVNFVRKNKNVNPDKVGLIGLSMGGFVAAYTAGVVRNIKSLALLSAVARYKKIMDRTLLKKSKFPAGGVDIEGLLVSKKFYNAVNKYDGLNLKSIKNYYAPLLVIHGTNDDSVPLEDGKIYYNTSVSLKKKLVIIKNGDHTFANVKIEKKVINIICKWFKEILR